ncbi:hypothetical protein BJV78DRAFT_955399 [Lactifluus subvellereus]|nr:hypothetical protein BJV78DRAFT_955399 [Lactifluus subvellereus]
MPFPGFSKGLPALILILRSYRSHDLMAGRLDNFFSHGPRKTTEVSLSEWTLLSTIVRWSGRSTPWIKIRSSRSSSKTEREEAITCIGCVDGPYFDVRPGLRVDEALKQWRIIIFSKFIEGTPLLGLWYPRLPISTSVQERDERWFQLMIGQLKVSKSVVRNYLTHCDSVLLATLIHISRQTVETCSGLEERRRSHFVKALPKTVESVFTDHQRTHPGSNMISAACGTNSLTLRRVTSTPKPAGSA